MTTTCMFGAPPWRARWAALLVHGRTQQPADMYEMIVRRLPWREVSYLAPSAPQASWYPGRFMEPLEINQPQLDESLATVQQLSNELVEQGFPPERQLLVGFSQGACLCAEFLWRRGRPMGGLMAFTGGLIGETLPPEPRGQAFDGMPIILTTCEGDGWVPPGRVRESARLFESAGGRVTCCVEEGAEHAIRARELDRAVSLLSHVT